MYIMNNITVTGGISENIYTLVSFSTDAVVLRRDLYNFSRHIQLIQLRLSSEGQKSKPQNLDLQARKAFWDIN
jgi:hypothetical protein